MREGIESDPRVNHEFLEESRREYSESEKNFRSKPVLNSADLQRPRKTYWLFSSYKISDRLKSTLCN